MLDKDIFSPSDNPDFLDNRLSTSVKAERSELKGSLYTLSRPTVTKSKG